MLAIVAQKLAVLGPWAVPFLANSLAAVVMVLMVLIVMMDMEMAKPTVVL